MLFFIESEMNNLDISKRAVDRLFELMGVQEDRGTVTPEQLETGIAKLREVYDYDPYLEDIDSWVYDRAAMLLDKLVAKAKETEEAIHFA